MTRVLAIRTFHGPEGLRRAGAIFDVSEARAGQLVASGKVRLVVQDGPKTVTRLAVPPEPAPEPEPGPLDD